MQGLADNHRKKKIDEEEKVLFGGEGFWGGEKNPPEKG